MKADETLLLSSKGNKGFAFGNGIMPCADGGTEDQLRPQALCAGPLARWHKPQLVRDQKSIGKLKTFARTRYVSRNMRKSPCGTFFGLRQRSKRAYGVVARTCPGEINRTFAHILRFDNTMPPERYDRKSSGRQPFCIGTARTDF